MSTYVPGNVRSFEDVQRELSRLRQALERAWPYLIREVLHSEPTKMVAGMEVIADGTDWDPGSISTEAFYRRNATNTAWDLVEATTVAADLAAHLADTTAAHAASAISNTPAGTVAATDVQAAINELDSEKTKESVVPSTAPSSGQILVGNAGGTAYAPKSMSGDLTIDSTGAATIANAAVSLAKMANLSANSIIGNNTGSSATPIALSSSQVKTLLAISTSDVSGLGTIATQASNNVSITGGSITGLTSITSSSGGVSAAAQFTSSGAGSTLQITDTGANGAGIKLTGNGATTPNKFIRAFNGNLGFLNSAFSATIAKMTDTGSFVAEANTAIPAGGSAGVGLMVSSTTNFGMFFGSGAPTLSAAKGSLYLRSDGSGTSDRAYINTNGSTTWTNLTTAA